jgi:hypothetical protein
VPAFRSGGTLWRLANRNSACVAALENSDRQAGVVIRVSKPVFADGLICASTTLRGETESYMEDLTGTRSINSILHRLVREAGELSRVMWKLLVPGASRREHRHTAPRACAWSCCHHRRRRCSAAALRFELVDSWLVRTANRVDRILFM